MTLTVEVLGPMSAGRPVPVDRLVAAVWGDDLLPDNARRVVQTYVARLRATLGPTASAPRAPAGTC